mgnify:CR=1 FL=1|tara:strand:+ start:267 stop:590 length:324 start_codon:yes stop_codon:yes gene_type:complete
MKRLLLALIAALALPTAVNANGKVDIRSSESFYSFFSGAIAAICQAKADGYISTKNAAITIKDYLNAVTEKENANEHWVFEGATNRIISGYSEATPACAKILNSLKK